MNLEDTAKHYCRGSGPKLKRLKHQKELDAFITNAFMDGYDQCVYDYREFGDRDSLIEEIKDLRNAMETIKQSVEKIMEVIK